MYPKTLIIHHLEKEWESGYRNRYETFESLQEKVVRSIKKNKYNNIILTKVFNFAPEDYRYDFIAYINQIHNYEYGWDKFAMEENPSCFVPGGSHSEAVLIDDWMQKLPKAGVTICGGFDGECIEDLEIALKYLGIKYRRNNNLIV